MSQLTHLRLIWAAGAIQAAIVLVNAILPGRLQVREKVARAPQFIRQILYVHWMYIVLTVAMFSALCFGFARDLAGASLLGRFLSAFLSGFWVLRVALQWFYYDREVRRANRWLDTLYLAGLIALSVIFARAALAPVA